MRGDVGYARMDANDLVANGFAFSSVSVDNTWGLGAGIGIYFGGGVRGDLTCEWLASTDVHATGVAVADFELDTQVLLANLDDDFHAGAGFTPYIGIGVGAAFHSASCGTVTLTCDGTCNFDGEQADAGGGPDGGLELALGSAGSRQQQGQQSRRHRARPPALRCGLSFSRSRQGRHRSRHRRRRANPGPHASKTLPLTRSASACVTTCVKRPAVTATSKGARGARIATRAKRFPVSLARGASILKRVTDQDGVLALRAG